MKKSELKIITISWALWALVCVAIAFLVGYCAPAKAKDEFVDCTYKPSQSDEVRFMCGTLTEGKGYVNIWICGQLYTFDIICPQNATEGKK